MQVIQNPITDPLLTRSIRYFVRMLCVPLARMAIRFDLSFDCVSRILAEAFVDAATKEFRSHHNRNPNDSEIQLVTGIFRKKVPELRSQVTPSDQDRTPVSKVFGGWMADPEFQDNKGQPAELPIKAVGAPSFAQLVRKYSKDLGYKPVLNLFQDSRVVEFTNYDMVRLIVDSKLSAKDVDSMLISGATSIRHHMDTVISNIRDAMARGEDAQLLLERKLLTRYLKEEDKKHVLNKLREIYDRAEGEARDLLDAKEVSPMHFDLVLVGIGFYQFVGKGGNNL